MEGALQHATAALVAGLQAPGAGGNLGQATGAWGCGKRYAFPTSPHPRLRLRTNIQRGVTLTFHLVQNIGQVTPTWRLRACPADPAAPSPRRPYAFHARARSPSRMSCCALFHLA